MKIRSLRIRNFGKLSEQSFHFQDGCNTILRENGWGKSTLAAFLKVMFYGFDGENKRSEAENERRRYKPWQGGVYGGSMVFEAGGKEYLAVREFGSKASEDTFELYDNATKLRSTEYTERLGEELFQIDAASFLRTVLVSQNDIETHATDSINAKLGNLTGVTDDINNFEAVSLRLKDEINHLTPNRATGLLAKMKNEETALKRDLLSSDSLNAKISGIDEALEAEQERLSETEGRFRALQEEQQRAAGQAAYLERKAQYLKLCRNHSEREQALRLAAQAFPRAVPEASALDAKIEEARQLRDLELQCALKEPSEEEKTLLRRGAATFDKGIPADDVISRYTALAAGLDEKTLQYRALQFSEQEQADYDALFPVYFGKEGLDMEADRLIRSWNQRLEKKSALESKRAALLTLQSVAAPRAPEKPRRIWLFFAAAGLVLLIAGAVLGHGTGYGAACVAAGAVALLCGAALRFLRRPAEKDEEDLSRAAGIQSLEAEIESDEALIRNAEQEVQPFLSAFGLSCGEADVLNALYSVKNSVARFRELSAKKDDRRDDELLASIREDRRRIEEFLSPYQMLLDPMADLRTQLSELQQSARAYGRALSAALAYMELKEKCRALAAPLRAYIAELGLACEEGRHLLDVLSAAKVSLDALLAARRELALAAAEKQAVEAREDFPQILAAQADAEQDRLAAFEARLAECQSEQRAAHERIKELSVQKDLCLEQRDELDAKAEHLTQLQQREEELGERFRLLSLTKELLEEAKTNFTKEYARPVSEAFSRYFEVLEGHPAEGISFDANGELLLSEGGRPRDIRLYSAGSRDKLYLCFRAAMIEAMFRSDSPILILDDPFTDLDEQRLAGALALLRMLGERHQILYLTCHRSRVPSESFL